MSRSTLPALAATAVLTLGSVAFSPPSAAADTSPAANRDEAQRKIAEDEVIANAKALAGTIAPFYGQAAADRLLQLLAGHWDAIHDFNAAMLKKSPSAQDQAVARLTNNARDIAKFLSAANPYLPEEAVFGLLSGHGGHHVAQIKQIAAGDFQGEAATWHAMRKHVMVISDAIAGALAKQFPDRFQASA